MFCLTRKWDQVPRDGDRGLDALFRLRLQSGNETTVAVTKANRRILALHQIRGQYFVSQEEFVQLHLNTLQTKSLCSQQHRANLVEEPQLFVLSQVALFNNFSLVLATDDVTTTCASDLVVLLHQGGLARLEFLNFQSQARVSFFRFVHSFV